MKLRSMMHPIQPFMERDITLLPNRTISKRPPAKNRGIESCQALRTNLLQGAKIHNLWCFKEAQG